MTGVDHELGKHHLVLRPDAKLVKQKLRKLHSKPALQVRDEVDKLYKEKFIKVACP